MQYAGGILLPPVQTLVATIIFAIGKNANESPAGHRKARHSGSPLTRGKNANESPVAVPGSFLADSAAASSADRGHSLPSLYPPPAAVGSLPSGSSRSATQHVTKKQQISDGYLLLFYCGMWEGSNHLNPACRWQKSPAVHKGEGTIRTENPFSNGVSDKEGKSVVLKHGVSADCKNKSSETGKLRNFYFRWGYRFPGLVPNLRRNSR